MSNDHRRLGRELGLFDTHELVGAGLPLWLPDGAVVRAELERFRAEQVASSCCRPVYTPVLGKRELFDRSGHLAKFADDMFPPMRVGGEDFVLRPANCPHHALVYAAGQRSYRDLPLRLAELGEMFRSEASGVLGGLSRVRQISLDDAHVFCTEDQIEDEVAAAVRQLRQCYGVLGIEIAYFRLSLRGDGGKYLGGRRSWNEAENGLRAAMERLGVDYRPVAGEAAFYGPKIDVQIIDAAGREESLSTVQIDFNQPERFGLEYIGADGARHRPVMIHRGLLSSMERLVACLIERYGGAFPPWLSPVQLAILPVGRAHVPAAKELSTDGIRADVDDGENTLALRVRRARERKIPYLAVIGDRELADRSVTLRLRDGRQLSVSVERAFDEMRRVIRDRRRDLGFVSR